MAKESITIAARAAGKKTAQMRECYVGLSDAQTAALDKYKVDPIGGAPKNVRQALIARKLFTEAGNITKLGAHVWKINRYISAGVFEPAESLLTKEQLSRTELINLALASRSKQLREVGLQSQHVKFMLIVMRLPGISIFCLEKAFAVHVFSAVISRGLCSRHADSHQIFITARGQKLIKELIGLSEEKRKGKTDGKK